METQLHKIFVYGTLKTGQRNHYLMQDTNNGVAKFIGKGELLESYPLVRKTTGKKSPCLLPNMPSDKPENIVKGELYHVDTPMLTVLDELEQHPRVYIRRPIKCKLTDGNGSIVDCQIYFLKDPSPEMYCYPYFNDYKD